MPQFLITAPDGREFEVTGPEGSTAEQALARVKAQYTAVPATTGLVGMATPDTRGEFAKGFDSGLQNMQGMAYGFAGLLGDAAGHEGLKEWGLENYQRNQQEAAASAPRIGSFRQIENVEDFFDFTAGVLGQTAPFSLTTVAGGGMGALLTRAIAPRMLAKKIGEETTKAAVERVLKDKAAKTALTKLVKRGAMTGSFLTSAATQQGGLYGELKEAGVDEAVIPAWVGGSIMGALDIAPEAFLLNKLFSPAKVTKELNESLLRSIGGAAKRVGKVAAQQTVLEGVTEGLQETTALLTRAAADENFNWDDKANERVLDAIVAGGIAGLFLGGGGGALAELTRKREVEGKKDDKARSTSGAGSAGGAAAATAAVEPPAVAGEPGGTGSAGVQPETIPPGPGASVDAAPPSEAAPPAPSAPAADPLAAGDPAASAAPAPSEAERAANVLRRAQEAIAAYKARSVAPTEAEPEVDAEAIQQELARRDQVERPQAAALEAPSPREALRTVQLLAANGVRGASVQGSSVIVAPEHQARAAEILANLGAQETAPTAPTPTVTDSPSAQSARRLAAELSELANKDAPRQGVYVSADSLAHPPVAARIAALKRGKQFVVTENADGKGGVLVSSQKTAQEFSQAIAAGENPEALFGQYTGAATVTPTKPETDSPLVVQRRDADGTVVQESVVDGADSDAGVRATEMVSQQPGEVAVVSPQEALAEREAEVQQEFVHPWLSIKTPGEMREFLATDPPFLGDPNTWSAEEAEAYEATGIMFLTWVTGKLPGYKKPASYLRETYKAWRAEKFKDRPVMDFDMGSAAYDLPIETSPSTPERVPQKFNRDQQMLVRSVVDKLQDWNTDEAARLEVLNHILYTQPVTEYLFDLDRRGATPREMAAAVIHMVKGDPGLRTFAASPEQEADSAAGSVSFEELGEREISRAILIGQDNIIDSARVPRSKKERSKGIGEEARAKPWKEESAAELAARMWKAYDKTMDYFVQYVDEKNFRQFGYDEMPAGGKGYYIAAIPTFNAETYYSTLVGAELGTAQLVNLFLMRAKRRWHDVYPEKVKEHEHYDYGIEAKDSKGKTVMLATRDIVDLGYVYDPSLREMRGKNRAKANFHAFITGVGLIQTSATDLKLTFPQTAREIAGPSGQKDMLDPRMLRGLRIFAWTVLEHRKGGSPQTVAHAIADSMFTKQELAKISEEAAAKVGPKATPEELYRFVESEKLRYIRSHYSARYAKAIDQANALLKLGVATTRSDRAASKRLVTMRKRLAAFTAQLQKARDTKFLPVVKGQSGTAAFEQLEARILGLDARLAEYERQQGAAGFDPREEAAEFSDLARDAAEMFGLNFLSEQTLAVTDPNEAQGNNLDSADNQGGQYMIAETEAAQMARSISGSDFTPGSPSTKNREGNSAMGTFAPTAPGLLGNSPAVAPSAAPTSELNITVELPGQETYVDEAGNRQVRPTGTTVQRTLPAREASGGILPLEPGKGITDASPLPPEGRREIVPPTPAPAAPAPRATLRLSKPRRSADSGFFDGVATRFRNSKRGTAARRIATELRKLLKLDSELIFVDSAEAALDYADMYGDLFDRREIEEHTKDRGQTGVVFRRPGVAIVYMNPNSKDLSFLKSIAHEIGHVFYYEQWSRADSIIRMRVTREYEAWLKTPQGQRNVELRAKKGDVYNIDEWIADNVAAWAVTDKKAVSAVEKFFETLAVALKRVYDYMQAGYGGLNETVAEFINESIARQPAAPATKRQGAAAPAQDISDWDYAAVRAAVNKMAFQWIGKPPGTPMNEIEMRDICLGTAKAIRDKLSALGLPSTYVSFNALSPLGQYKIGHYAAMTEIDGQRYLVDMPQTEMMYGRELGEDATFVEALAIYDSIGVSDMVPRSSTLYHHAAESAFVGTEPLTGFASQWMRPRYRKQSIVTARVALGGGQFEGPLRGAEYATLRWREAPRDAEDGPGGVWVEDVSIRNPKGLVTYVREQNYAPRLIPVEKGALAAAYGGEPDQYVGTVMSLNQFFSFDNRGNDRGGTVNTSFESLGAANDIAFDMNVEPNEPPSHIKRSWDWLRGLRAKYPTLDKWVSFIFDSALALHEKIGARVFMRVKRLGIPAFDDIMAHFYHEIGTDLTAEGRSAATFFSDSNGWLNTFRNRYNAIMGDMDIGAKTVLMNEALLERTPPEGFKYKAQLDQLRTLLTEVRKYAVDAGLPINEVTNYFTQVYDKEALREEGAVDEIMAALAAAGAKDPVTDKPYTKEQVTRIIEGMLDDTYAVDTDPAVDIKDTLGHRAPFAQALRHRTMPDAVRNAIRSIADSDGRAKYMSKSIDSVMNTYFAQMTQRAEYNRRLGDPDFVEELAKWNSLTDEEKMEMNSNGQDLQRPKPVFDPHRKLKLMLERAVSEGAGQPEIDFMYDVISAMLHQYERIENPNLRTLTNGMMLYQNMRTLLFVTLSSIPDLANNFIQTGEFKDTFRIMRENAKAALKGELHDVLSLHGYAADALDGSFMREMGNWRDGDNSISKWNERFFTAVGLHKWTNFTRALGLKVSMHYIEKHARLAAQGEADSQRRMGELGITPEDVQAWIDSGYQTKFSGNTDERVGRVTSAIQRMVDHVQVHPTPPEKSLWGNSEMWKLLFHLKGFMYAFATRVLGRAYHEITRKGATTAQQAATLGAVALLLPLAAFGLMLRDLFQYWLWGKEAYTPYDDPLAYLGHLAGRSGITGFGQVAVDVMMAGSRGRAPLLAAAGPTVTWVNDWIEYPIHKTLPGSIPLISSVPGIRNELGLLIKGEPAAQ